MTESPTQPTLKALRVFFSVYTKGSAREILKGGGWNWKREKQHFDYTPGTNPKDAEADIMKQYGERPDSAQAIHAKTFAVVHSYRVIPDLPAAEFKGWRAIEQPLFDPITLKNCLSEKPRYRR